MFPNAQKVIRRKRDQPQPDCDIQIASRGQEARDESRKVCSENKNEKATIQRNILPSLLAYDAIAQDHHKLYQDLQHVPQANSLIGNDRIAGPKESPPYPTGHKHQRYHDYE